MASSGMLRRVALVRTDVSEEPSAPIIRVTRIGELGTMLALTSNRRTLRRNRTLHNYLCENLKPYLNNIYNFVTMIYYRNYHNSGHYP
jgi:hypothetical protein